MPYFQSGFGDNRLIQEEVGKLFAEVAQQRPVWEKSKELEEHRYAEVEEVSGKCCEFKKFRTTLSIFSCHPLISHSERDRCRGESLVYAGGNYASPAVDDIFQHLFCSFEICVRSACFGVAAREGGVSWILAEHETGEGVSLVRSHHSPSSLSTLMCCQLRQRLAADTAERERTATATASFEERLAGEEEERRRLQASVVRLESQVRTCTRICPTFRTSSSCLVRCSCDELERSCCHFKVVKCCWFFPGNLGLDSLNKTFVCDFLPIGSAKALYFSRITTE